MKVPLIISNQSVLPVANSANLSQTFHCSLLTNTFEDYNLKYYEEYFFQSTVYIFGPINLLRRNRRLLWHKGYEKQFREAQFL